MEVLEFFKKLKSIVETCEDCDSCSLQSYCYVIKNECCLGEMPLAIIEQLIEEVTALAS